MEERRNPNRVDQREIRRQLYLKRKRKHQQKQLLVFGSLILVLILLIVLLMRACAPVAEKKPIETKPTAPAPTEPVVQSTSANVLAVGDILMHQGIIDSVRQSDGSYDFSGLFANLKDEFTAADLACACMETILVENENDTSNGLPLYGTTSSLAPAIQAAGFDVVAQATEHAYDKGLDAVRFTKSTWNGLGVSAIGIHDSEADAQTVTVREVNGIKIAFLNYTYADSETVKARENYAVDYLESENAIAQQIAAAKQQSDIVIVFAHWGEMTTYEANDFQKTWAQFFADNGVGAVIGSHTHTLQPTAQITGANGNTMPVFYSLGNYMTHMSRYYNMLGGMAELTVTKDESGTRVSAYRLVPLVEVIDTTGSGFRFYTVKLADYTSEMAKSHQLDGTSVDNIQELYQAIFPLEQPPAESNPGESSSAPDTPSEPDVPPDPSTASQSESSQP